MKNKKQRVIVAMILIFEILITSYYNSHYSTYFGNIINILFLVNIVSMLIILFVFVKKHFSLKSFVINLIVSVVVMTFMLFNFGVIYHTSAKYSEYNVRNALGNEEHFMPWQYYNLLDDGYNSKVNNVNSYTFNKDSEYISENIVNLYDNENKNFAVNGLGGGYREILAYSNFNKLVSDNLGDLNQENSVLSGASEEHIMTSYNSGEFLYSLTSQENSVKINKFDQQGVLLSSQNIKRFEDAHTDININYVDEEDKKIYVSYMTVERDVKMVTIDEDFNVQEFLFVDIASKFNDSISIPRLIKLDKLDDRFRLTVGTYVYSSSVEYFAIYSAFLDEKGVIGEEFIYNAEPSLYYADTLNIAYEKDKVYIVSHVIDNDFTVQLAPTYDNNNNVIRIDELNNKFELEKIIYLESEELGDYSLHFKVENNDGKYSIYSNKNSIEFTVYPKEKLKVLNRELTSFAIIFIIVGLLGILIKKLRIYLKNIEHR